MPTRKWRCRRALGGLCLLLGFMLPAQALVFPFENVSAFIRSFDDNGYSRQALYLQPTAATQAKAPLILLLHPTGGNSLSMANLTLAGQLARDHGAWLILPQGVNGLWTDTPDTFRLTRKDDDVGFLLQLIDDALARYPIDVSRIYIGGYSRGGNLALRMACEHPDRIAAAVAIAATMRKAEAQVCAPALGTPILLMSGTLDGYEPYAGDSSNLSAADSAALWRTLDGCSDTADSRDLPDTVDEGASVHLDRYSQCSNGRVDFYTVSGGGHTWPGALDLMPLLGPVDQDVDATRLMWQFFSQWTRS